MLTRIIKTTISGMKLLYLAGTLSSLLEGLINYSWQTSVGFLRKCRKVPENISLWFMLLCDSEQTAGRL